MTTLGLGPTVRAPWLGEEGMADAVVADLTEKIVF